MNKLKRIKIVKKPWGQEIWFVQTEDYMGKILEINPYEELSFHKHKFKEETMYVVQGICLFTIEENDFKTLSSGESIHILPGVAHRMSPVGSLKVVLFEVSTPYPNDVVRIKDHYGRIKNKKN